MAEILVFSMFPALCLLLLTGFPVAFCLAGIGMLFAAIGIALGVFPPSYIGFFPDRVFGIVQNELFVAIPLFVFMGLMLERSGLAEQLLSTLGFLLARVPSGLAIGVTIVGALLAASTGVVGATVVAMGLLSLPTMIGRGYLPSFASGSICAAGTLGQIIPPSILLVLLADQTTNAYRRGQMSVGNMLPEAVSVLNLFAGALVPGLLLVLFYALYQLAYGFMRPENAPPVTMLEQVSRWELVTRVAASLVPPLFLMVAVLGSILAGIATPTEAASVGAFGAVILAFAYKRFTMPILREVMRGTLSLTAMIFTILIGATMFALVFRGLGGDEIVHELLTGLPGGETSAILLIMVLAFVLGCFLDFIEIIIIVVPVVGPALFAMDVNPLWFAILLAVNLQTSFLTPPFGFALFYLKGVAPPEVRMTDIYRGVIPFIAIQLFVLVILVVFPQLVTWLPEQIHGRPLYVGMPRF
jgi:tripartite ATP-independent transporter DctM subunit